MKIITVISINLDWDVDVFAHIWYDESWVGSYFWDQYKDRGRWDAELDSIYERKMATKGSRV